MKDFIETNNFGWRKLNYSITVISQGYQRNFLKFSTKWIDSRNIPYDYGSIMHYARAFFSRMPALLPTLVTHKDNVRIGQRIALSKSDVLQANILYNCDGKCWFVKQWGRVFITLNRDFRVIWYPFNFCRTPKQTAIKLRAPPKWWTKLWWHPPFPRHDATTKEYIMQTMNVCIGVSRTQGHYSSLVYSSGSIWLLKLNLSYPEILKTLVFLVFKATVLLYSQVCHIQKYWKLWCLSFLKLQYFYIPPATLSWPPLFPHPRHSCPPWFYRPLPPRP